MEIGLKTTVQYLSEIQSDRISAFWECLKFSVLVKTFLKQLLQLLKVSSSDERYHCRINTSLLWWYRLRMLVSKHLPGSIPLGD